MVNKLINIDGSHGEGGGQILRTAIGLSVIISEPVKITNIRANRPNPGIKPQHFTAIKIIKELCEAKTEGFEIGSSDLVFYPGEIRSGDYRFNIGTAGSIILVFQAIILSFLKTKKDITIELTGGTDVKWSPSWDYFNNVFLPNLKIIGVNVESKLLQRGYYPKGGGRALLHIFPNNLLKPLPNIQFKENEIINGNIHNANLPEHITKRIKHAAIKQLIKINLQTSIKTENINSLSSGTGITLWTTRDNSYIGSSVLGEKGVTAESIGELAASEIISDINSNANFDSHGFDQIIPYLALADGSDDSSCYVRNLSGHAETNIWLVSKFLNSNNMFKIEKKDNIYSIRIKGCSSILE